MFLNFTQVALESKCPFLNEYYGTCAISSRNCVFDINSRSSLNLHTSQLEAQKRCQRCVKSKHERFIRSESLSDNRGPYTTFFVGANQSPCFIIHDSQCKTCSDWEVYVGPTFSRYTYICGLHVSILARSIFDIH